MKQILTIILCSAFLLSLTAQESKWPKVDASAMDTEYFPANAAWRNYLKGEDRTKAPKMRVVYSSPKKNDRTIFGSLVPYGQVWRVGANEATEVTFYQAVSIGDVTVNPGTYTISALVNERNWDVRFSSQLGIWGSENLDDAQMVASIKVPSTMVSSSEEMLSMTFRELDPMTVGFVIQWDKTRVEIPIGLNPVQFSGADKSPMDKAHYPAKSAYTNYLKGEEANLKPKIQVTYSRPYKNDRNVFGDLLKTGDIWRIGANQSTEIVFFQDVTVGSEKLKKGKYVIYAELKEGSWDIIFSKDYPAWGNANRDEEKDVARVNIPTSMDKEVVENLSIIFDEKSDKKVHMVIAWDKTRAELPISF